LKGGIFETGTGDLILVNTFSSPDMKLFKECCCSEIEKSIVLDTQALLLSRFSEYHVQRYDLAKLHWFGVELVHT
jgi:hypothetical protein